MTLETLLGKELADQVTAKLGAVKLLIQEKDGDFLPKDRFDEVNNKKNDLQKELDSKVKALDKLQKELDKGNKSIEDQLTEANKKIEALENEKVSTQKEMLNSSKKNALERSLTNAKAKADYISLLTGQFNLDELELEGDGIKGFDEKLKPIQTKFKDLFGQTKIAGDPPKKPNFSEDPSEYYTMEQLSAMPQAEAVANIDKVNKSLAFHNSK